MDSSFSDMQPHDSAVANITGRSLFVDDRPILPGELFVGVVTSSCAHGIIESIDLEECKSSTGVVAVFTAKDLAMNEWGSIFHDQPFLADSKVQFYGEAVAIVAGEDPYDVAAACKKAKVKIKEQPALLSIEDAIAKEAFLGPARKIERGSVDKALSEAKNKLSGVVQLQGQDHFYLESQASVAYPNEGEGVEIHSSSQHPTEVQHLVAEALNLKHHQVVCVVKRMGGAFGGKESQAAPYAVFAALVAYKTNRPARCVLTKDEDMIATGKRNPFRIAYEVGFDQEGKISALKAQLHSDGGAYADLSTAIMERAMLHIDNAYYLPNIRVQGQVCKTHTHPSTAFRGFGGPKGVLVIESIMEEIAQHLGIDSLSVRRKNVYGTTENNVTHYGQTIPNNNLPSLFSQLTKECDYEKWRNEVEAHNQKDTSTLHGLSMTAVKFGISFTTRFLNQGNALVHLQMDGTVQVSTGATEMGQGVNSKIAKVVADVFGLTTADVRVMPTSTEKNHNTSATAASSGSDINGQAALAAAVTIRKRLESLAVLVLDRPESLRGRAVAGAGTAKELVLPENPGNKDVEFEKGTVFLRSQPNKSIPLQVLLEEAYLNRISLGERGFYRYPGIHFNKETGQGEPFLYFTTGVAASEVSIDRYTGEVKVLKTRILMDLGRSINEGIDLGQVTGAFVQGVGWLTTENLFYNDRGALVSHSPSTYKIPSVHDIPRDFTAKLLEGSNCPQNIKGSKAVGEPPLLLAISVWTAVKNALSYRWAERTRALPVPATAEEILKIMEGPN